MEQHKQIAGRTTTANNLIRPNIVLGFHSQMGQKLDLGGHRHHTTNKDGHYLDSHGNEARNSDMDDRQVVRQEDSK